jgi:hypothetical protein
MTTLNLSKAELKEKLRGFKAQGLTSIALNKSFNELESEYDRVCSLIPSTDILDSRKELISRVGKRHVDKIELTENGYCLNGSFQFTSNPNAIKMPVGYTFEVIKFVSDGAIVKYEGNKMFIFYDYYKNIK